MKTNDKTNEAEYEQIKIANVMLTFNQVIQRISYNFFYSNL